MTRLPSLCITLITGILISAALLPARQAVAMDIQSVTSPKYGLTAWLVEDHSIPLIAMEFGFKGAGSAQETPKTQGLARLMANTLDEGAGDMDAQSFQKTLEDQSITLYFNTSRDHFTGTLKTLVRTQDAAFALLKTALTEPRFDEDALNRMIQANQSRIRSAMTRPEWMAARLMNDAAFAGHPYALNSGGTLTTLADITPADLRAYHAKALARDNLIIAVAGDITAAQLADRLDSVFGNLPETSHLSPVEDLTLTHAGETWLYPYDIPQTIIAMAQPGIAITAPDYYHAKIMNFILGESGFGSRLTHSIREEKGLTYGIYTYFDHYDHVNALRLQTSTKNENVSDMLDLIHQEWQTMLDAPVTEDELADAKNYLIGQLPLTLTSTDKIASLMLYLQSHALPVDYLDQRETVIKNTSAEDVKTAAAKILKADQLTTILVGSPDSIQVDLTVTELPNVE